MFQWIVVIALTIARLPVQEGTAQGNPPPGTMGDYLQIRHDAPSSFEPQVPPSRRNIALHAFTELAGTVVTVPESLSGRKVDHDILVRRMAYGSSAGRIVVVYFDGVVDDGRQVRQTFDADQELESFDDFVGRKLLFLCTGTPRELLVESVRYGTNQFGRVELRALRGSLDDGSQFEYEKPANNVDQGECGVRAGTKCVPNPTCSPIGCGGVIMCTCFVDGHCEERVFIDCYSNTCTLPKVCVLKPDYSSCACVRLRQVEPRKDTP